VRSVEQGGTLGVVNSGYWGVPIQKGDSYSFSLFVKGDDRFAGSSLKVSLRDEALETIYAEEALSDVGTDWQKKTCRLVPGTTDWNGRLVISAADAGVFWLSVVSLFPPTWKNQPNGLRPDLVQLLADLKPSFFRFPGGCFAEGRTLEDTFLFKETIGPIEQRKGRPCFWGYHSSDGLGYYEYLRLAEDLGADPIFCINPGANNGARQVIAMEDMEPWYQKAVDAVEFAIGAPDSRWGSKRAAMGHTEPFSCRTFYLQVGNETEFSYEAYVERFKVYRERVKAAFPGDQVKVLADSWGMKHRQTVDTYAIDYHRYMSWQDAVHGRDQYDDLPRGRPYVFKGEYATRSGSGILQALSEAVYMMGLEENSDEVVLAAYAPLFANVNGTQWKPDLIYFDNHRSMGTISYWVQQMFSAHRGDRLLPLELEEVRTSPEEEPTLTGSIGVGSWSTRVEYKDIRVVSGGKTVLEADVSDREQWQTLNGTWEFNDDVLRQTSRAEDCRAWVQGKTWSQYQLHLKARKTGGAEGFLVLFHVRNTEDYVWANLGGWGNSQHAIERADGGSKVQSRRVRGRIETGRWYDIRIDVDGNDIECLLDGDVVCTADLGRMRRTVTDDLYANASLDEAAGEILVRVVNLAEEPKRVSLSFSGLTGLQDEATVITLHAEDRSASQSLEDPLRYRPETEVLRGLDRAFDHEFKPCSFTILRLKPR
jgi:alpha-L-arabinofuranosidase